MLSVIRPDFEVIRLNISNFDGSDEPALSGMSANQGFDDLKSGLRVIFAISLFISISNSNFDSSTFSP
jgi:hypothetical protein